MKYDEETKIMIRDMYLSGINSTEISKNTGIKQATITQWLRKFGVTRHRGPKSKIGREDFFDNIDCEKKAYYLGWLMADGCISIYNNQYSIKINISAKDSSIVFDFLKDIQSSNKVRFHTEKSPMSDNYNDYCYVSLTSVHMCKSLIKLGVVPNKSGHEKIPDIPNELKHHFIRGFFDGDGIVDTKKGKRTGFVSNKEMLKSILKEVNLEKKIKLLKHHTTPWLRYFLISKKDSRQLYEYMYKDATIWIPRRKEQLTIVCS